ncbi:MAG: DNA polymerase I [Silvanigrellales bacterium]|nr:DNA polymerase I [Silvanigrellales bacterium]
MTAPKDAGDKPASASDLKPKLYLVDGMALLFRSFYAMGRANLTSPEGKPIGAVYGFLRIVQKILKEQGATHFAVTWDLRGPTFRHEMFPAYKGTRSETPPELLEQIPLIKSILDQCAVPCFSKERFEGDDVLGTLALRFASHGEVYIVSSDKDFMQLVGGNVRIFSLKSGDDYVLLEREAVKDYFGVPPEQVVDVLAIMGDKVDNVPGVKGIGEKGAAKLIQEFGSLEGVYANLEKISNVRLRGLLETHRAEAHLSKELVTIDVDVPLKASEEDLRYDWVRFCTEPGVRQALSALKMPSLLRGLDGGSPRSEAWPQAAHLAATAREVAAPKAVRTPAYDLFGNALESEGNSESSPDVNGVAQAHGHTASTQEDNLAAWGARKYDVVTTRSALQAVLARIASPQTSAFAFDTETTGLDVIDNRPIGFSVSFEEGTGVYVPAHDVHLKAGALSGRASDAEFSAEEAWAGLRDALHARTGVLVAHNLKFDAHMLCNVGVSLGGARVADTMVASWLLEPSFSVSAGGMGGGYGLDALTLRHFGLKKIPTSALIGKETGRSTMLEVPLVEIAEYASEDVDACLRLWNRLLPLLNDSDTGKEAQGLFWDMEMPLLRLLVDMERAGVHIDSNYLAEYAGEVQERLTSIEQEVHRVAGTPFNLASPKQLGSVLFETLKVHESVGFKGKLAKTSLGYKTDAAVLEQFAAHPVVALVLEYRELSKLLGTYILVLPQLVKSSTGRIHTHFNQIGTATGRLSSNDPNLQNIPVRTPLGKKVRKAFCATAESNCIISADYSQVELRVLAHLAQDPNMLEAFQKGADIHRETAAKILGKEPGEVTPEERAGAKAINFGIIYGMGAQRLARERKISQAEAKSFIEKYFMNFAKVREFLDAKKVEAYEKGYVATFFGRRRPVNLRGGMNPAETKAAENVAINSPIQGTAADIMKLGMLRAHKALVAGGYRTRILLQVHDELVLEGPRTEAEEVSRLVRKALEGAVDFSIPLLVEVSQGRNWLEAK